MHRTAYSAPHKRRHGEGWRPANCQALFNIGYCRCREPSISKSTSNLLSACIRAACKDAVGSIVETTKGNTKKHRPKLRICAEFLCIQIVRLEDYYKHKSRWMCCDFLLDRQIFKLRACVQTSHFRQLVLRAIHSFWPSLTKTIRTVV